MKLNDINEQLSQVLIFNNTGIKDAVRNIYILKIIF